MPRLSSVHNLQHPLHAALTGWTYLVHHRLHRRPHTDAAVQLCIHLRPPAEPGRLLSLLPHHGILAHPHASLLRIRRVAPRGPANDKRPTTVGGTRAFVQIPDCLPPNEGNGTSDCYSPVRLQPTAPVVLPSTAWKSPCWSVTPETRAARFRLNHGVGPGQGHGVSRAERKSLRGAPPGARPCARLQPSPSPSNSLTHCFLCDAPRLACATASRRPGRDTTPPAKAPDSVVPAIV